MTTKLALLTIGLILSAGAIRPDPPAAAPANPTATAKSPAAQALDRLKNLEGAWRGKSTKGWTDQCTFRTIAAGSCVIETSDFEAHPGQTMVTMYHMDGADLMLTHYCVAKNQPRLTATDIAADAATVTFTFKDGTNLSSRDQGHMDKVVYRFDSSEAFSSQWTWYQKGEEKWMEEIKYERTKPDGHAAADKSPDAAATPACHPTSSPQETGDTQMPSPIGYDGGLTCAMQVTDMNRSIKWYTDTLGFTLLYKLDEMGWAELSTEVARVNIGLSQVETITGRGNTKLTFGVKDIDKARAQLESKGVKFDGPTVEIPGMVKLATFFDPDQNVAMFYQDLQKK